MSTVLDRFIEERNQTIAQAEAFIERAGDNFDPADESYKALRTRAEELNTRIADLNELQETKAAAGVLDGKLSRSNAKIEVKERTTEASFGEQFVRSQEFVEYRGRGTMATVNLDGFLSRAALTTADFWANTTVREPAERPFSTPVQDSCTIVPVTSNSVDIVTYELTNNATGVPEGMPKPESVFEQTVTPITLATVAHHISFSRQLAEDQAAVRARIDGSMRRGVLQKLEDQAAGVIVGGTYGTAVSGGGDLMAGIRKAIGELQAKYSPSTVYLNPGDWADLDIATQGDGSNGVLRSTYWGLTIVPVAALDAGTALVADSTVAFEVYRRTAVASYLTDSHASNFTSNILTLLAEARQKSVVVDPQAVRKVTKA